MNSTDDKTNEDEDSRAWTADPIVVTIHLAFAFDIGYEIDLERARLLLQGEPGPVAATAATPESIGYRPAPIRVEIEPAGLDAPGRVVVPPPPAGRADALRLRRRSRWPCSSRCGRRPRHCWSWPAAGRAGPAHRGRQAPAGPWLERITPAVHDFDISELSEEYIVFQLGNIARGWLDDRTDWIAGLVRLEPEPLSRTKFARRPG